MLAKLIFDYELAKAKCLKSGPNKLTNKCISLIINTKYTHTVYYKVDG